MLTQQANQPILTERLGYTFIGYEVRTTNALESNPSTAKIGAAWRHVFSQNLLAAIPQTITSSKLYGLYTRFSSDYRGEFSVVIAAETLSTADAPETLTKVITTPNRYLVFTGQGPMPQTVLQTWQNIWAYFADPQCKHQRSYLVDFESYDGTKPEVIEIYIGIQ